MRVQAEAARGEVPDGTPNPTRVYVDGPAHPASALASLLAPVAVEPVEVRLEEGFIRAVGEPLIRVEPVRIKTGCGDRWLLEISGNAAGIDLRIETGLRPHVPGACRGEGGGWGPLFSQKLLLLRSDHPQEHRRLGSDPGEPVLFVTQERFELGDGRSHVGELAAGVCR
jgi:hypothetical protein